MKEIPRQYSKREGTTRAVHHFGRKPDGQVGPRTTGQQIREEEARYTRNVSDAHLLAPGFRERMTNLPASPSALKDLPRKMRLDMLRMFNQGIEQGLGTQRQKQDVR